MKEAVDKVFKILSGHKIDDWLKLSQSEPDLFTFFKHTEDQINDWRNLTEDKIDYLDDKADLEIGKRKALVQSIFYKQEY